MPAPSTLVFYALAALVLLGAVGVAFVRNVLHAALMLLATLAGTAGLYLYLGADFLGMAQLLVYVGGVLVLLLFAVLLTSGIGEVRLQGATVSVRVAAPVVVLAIAGLATLLLRLGFPTTQAVAAPTTLRIGDGFLREWLLPFELISLVLLAALVGAMVLARRAARPRPDKNRQAPPP